MSAFRKSKLIAKSMSGILLVTALMTVCPILAYAASDNPSTSTLTAFPEIGTDSDTMNENLGTINTLYAGGVVSDNKGTIANVSGGTVSENHGSIDVLSAGHVGTNYLTINNIQNTGSLAVNDQSGTIQSVGMGTAVERNDGTISENIGTVSDNYGTINDNYGTVVMRDGQIVNNCQNGTVKFEAKTSGGETIPAKGTIGNNNGKVYIHSGNAITITENTGNIEIDNATVTVNKNSGNITVGENATLHCTENESSGVIAKASVSAVVNCTTDNGLIYDATVDWYKIVFAGDDGKATVEACDLDKDGFHYTAAGGNVIFTLPSEYKCDSASPVTGFENTWKVVANPAEGDTEFTITCRKHSICDLDGHRFITYISDGNATCTTDGTKTATCENGCGTTDTVADTGSAGHTYGGWVTIKPATETETGIKERTCSVCGNKDSSVIPALPHHNSGTPMNGPSTTYTTNGTKTVTGVTGYGATDIAVNQGTVQNQSHAGRKFAIEPAETESLDNDTQENSVSQTVTYSIVSGANSEWTKGDKSGLVFISDTPFDKFESVKIDDATIETTDYTAESGSTKITISPEYLETLSIGEHSVEIVFTDGSAFANFAVLAAQSTDLTNTTDIANSTDSAKPADTPSSQAGDSGHILLGIVILFVSIGALVGIFFYIKKRRDLTGRKSS